MVKKYILTGTPGSGKTSIIRALEKDGYDVIDEAATEVIANEQKLGNNEPWKYPEFIDSIIELQKEREILASKHSSQMQFYDRSPICTYALAIYLGFKPSQALLEEIDRIQNNQIYQKNVILLENLGFCTPTDARKISYEDSLIFEKIHEATYTKFGYICQKILPTSVEERVSTILRIVK